MTDDLKQIICIAFGGLLITTSFAHATERYNILFMLSDDQAWNGLSTPMHPDVPTSKHDVIQTPRLQRLAQQGISFSAAYAPSPVCAATRISLQVGQTPARLHWTKAAKSVSADDGFRMIPPINIRDIPDDAVTIAEVLKANGYATAHYGKWHINGGGPGKHGYDEHDGDIGNEHAHQFADPNPADIFGMADRAVAFMKNSSQGNKPFFIQMSWHALHAPQNALKKSVEKYEQLMPNGNEKSIGTAAISEDLDTGVGVVLDAIERLKIADRTYVVYMSDNGSGGRSLRGTLSGGKGSLREGGIRVPLIVRGPGIPANSFSHERVVGFDLFPTFCDWASVDDTDRPKGLEGGSIASICSQAPDATVKRPRPELVFHFPHYQSDDGPHSAIMLDKFKLLHLYESGQSLLFDLSVDRGEWTDLATSLPDHHASLRQRLAAYLKEVNAQMPVPNPKFDPDNPPTLVKGGSRDKNKRDKTKGIKKGKAK